MKINDLKVLLWISGMLWQTTSMSQPSTNTYPVIGKLIPELKLTDVRYYSKKKFDPREVQSKWTIMYFWSKGCTVCVQSFPKLNQLQSEFKEQVQFILVAKNDKKNNANIEQIFERYRKTLRLQLPIAYDSVIFSQFGIYGVPHVIIVDPSANVYAVTNSEALNKENLRNLISNDRPVFKRKYSTFEQEPSFEEGNWKYLTDEHEKRRDFLFRSVLSENNGEYRVGSARINEHIEQGFYQITLINLFHLYNIAYLGESDWSMGTPFYGKNYKYPILEIHDSSFFYNTEGEKLYNYSLISSKKKPTKEYLMEVMQLDLKNYFGYEVSLETRMMPYWKLTATEEAEKKIKTKSESFEIKSEPIGLDGKRITISHILFLIDEYNYGGDLPFIDETNIEYKIDISLNAVMTDMNDIKKALRSQGLILEKSVKKMDVLVIRDPANAKLVTP